MLSPCSADKVEAGSMDNTKPTAKFDSAPEWSQRQAEVKKAILDLCNVFIGSHRDTWGKTKAVDKFCSHFERGHLGQDLRAHSERPQGFARGPSASGQDSMTPEGSRVSSNITETETSESTRISSKESIAYSGRTISPRPEIAITTLPPCSARAVSPLTPPSDAT
jgi:hypothetical protein